MSTSPSPHAKPHILLVTIDTLRADHLGCYGARHVRTPNLDAFAASGVRFGFHLSSLATTLPSHTSLMTGCTPSVHGINWNGVTRPRRRKTAAELARDAGYATTAITSWKGFQNQQVFGFDHAYSEGGAGADTNRGDYTLQRVTDWLETVDPDQPQMLWVHFIDPHTPDNCPEPFPQTYVGEVEFVDTMLGRMLEAWDAKLRADRSFTVVTADHGEHLNDHGVERGHGTLWLTNLHIPLAIRAPNLIEPGTVVPELTRQIDVLPTLLDYLELPMPHNVEGMSLRGLIEGDDRDLHLAHVGQAINDERFALTLRNQRYALHFAEDMELAHVFDLGRDLGEAHDLWQAPHDADYSVEHSVRDGKEK